MRRYIWDNWGGHMSWLVADSKKTLTLYRGHLVTHTPDFFLKRKEHFNV